MTVILFLLYGFSSARSLDGSFLALSYPSAMGRVASSTPMVMAIYVPSFQISPCLRPSYLTTVRYQSSCIWQTQSLTTRQRVWLPWHTIDSSYLRCLGRGTIGHYAHLRWSLSVGLHSSLSSLPVSSIICHKHVTFPSSCPSLRLCSSSNFLLLKYFSSVITSQITLHRKI